MPKDLKTKRGGGLRLLCVLLCCAMMYGIFCTTLSASTDVNALSENNADVLSADDSTDTLPEGENEGEGTSDDTAAAKTLSGEDVKSIAEMLAAAAGNSKAEDTRTPRDMLTAAYLAGDIESARAAIKQANDDLKKPLAIDYASLNMADVSELIVQMKTKIVIEPASGFFAMIMNAAGAVLSWITNALGGGNYIVGLLIFSLIIELVMLPLGIKQQKNSIRQATLKPKEAAIRKKYAGREDQVTKRKITTEIQELYQRENFNPASGCLPALIQLPVILLLYNVVVNPIVYVMKLSAEVSNALMIFANTSVEAGGLGHTISASRGSIGIASMITDTPDFYEKLRSFLYFTNGDEIANAVQATSFPNFNFFGLNLGLVPSLTDFSWLLIFPVLTFVVYFASMKITRKVTYAPAATDQAMGCSNNIMDIGMPLFSVFISFNVPAALGLYWITKSILGTASKLALTKVMPLPKFTEEDYKAAEKELKKGSKDNGKPSQSGYRTTASGKPVRSLHRIDDEDFDDTRDRALAQKAKLEEEERRAAEEAESKKKAVGVKSDDDRPMLSLREMMKKRKEDKNADGKDDIGGTGAPESDDGGTDKDDTSGKK